ncbi:MAG: SRPBCC family protein [Solirubrobacterales bacterium]
MSTTEIKDPALDLTISRIIEAPREAVWEAWTDPASFEQWWLPAPEKCKVEAMELQAGGAFRTLMSSDGEDWQPHLNSCFLAVDEGERIVFTTALTAGWRPSSGGLLMTAEITLKDHPRGTEYASYVMHEDSAGRDLHEEMGFQDGWGTVIGQLAELVETRSR